MHSGEMTHKPVQTTLTWWLVFVMMYNSSQCTDHKWISRSMGQTQTGTWHLISCYHDSSCAYKCGQGILRGGNSVQEEVPDACSLYPWDVGCGASEDAGLVLHGASNRTKAHNPVDLPAVTPHLAQQRAARVTL